MTKIGPQPFGHTAGLTAMLLALSGCEQSTPAFTDAQMDEIQKLIPGMTPECVERVRKGGIEAFPKAVDECFEMTTPDRWSGLWRNDFEGSRFCPDPAEDCTYQTPGDDIWLSFSEDAHDPKFDRAENFEKLYRIDFVGRRTVQRGTYGHLDGSDYEMVVDELLSIRELTDSPEAE